MLTEELRKKVKLIEMNTRKKVNHLMTGQYKSLFKGHGIQFAEHRVYIPGDDIRHIDWKVSARTKDPLIKKFDEERELAVFILVDLSASGDFGSGQKTKKEVLAETAALLAYAAHQTGDRVGAILFDGRVQEILKPQKGRHQLLNLIEKIISFKGDTLGTDLKTALEASHRIMKHAGVVFVISDFKAEGFETELKRMGKKHDCIAVRIGDQREFELPDVGGVFLLNPETQEETWVNTSSKEFQKFFNQSIMDYDKLLEKNLRSSKMDYIHLKTNDDYIDAMVKFFNLRSKKRN